MRAFHHPKDKPGLSSRTPARDAFTLVELLVVVAIVAILAGMLLPALSRARGCARQARCTTNLRQYGVAAQLYWDDFGGTAFPERGARTNGGWSYWFGWLADGVETEREFDNRCGALWPYLGSRGVEICPSLDQRNPRFKAKARGAASGYGYNLLLGPRDRPPVNIARLGTPSGLAVFADCAQVNDFLAPASADNPLLEEFYYFETNTLSATVHFRHRARAVAAFADGHVASAEPDAASLDRRLPGQLLGRLPNGLVAP